MDSGGFCCYNGMTDIIIIIIIIILYKVNLFTAESKWKQEGFCCYNGGG